MPNSSGATVKLPCYVSHLPSSGLRSNYAHSTHVQLAGIVMMHARRAAVVAAAPVAADLQVAAPSKRAAGRLAASALPWISN